MMKRANSVNLKLATLLLCFSLLSNNAVFAVTQAKMNASVDAPTLRGAYASPKLNNNSTNIKLEGDISLTKGNQIICVSLRDSDVKQALRMFADKAGLNIVFHKSVDGKITMDLVNVTLNNAFKMIMQMAELSYVIEHDTIMVMSAEASKTMSVSMENMSTIPVKYADASSLAQFLNKNIFSSNKPGLSNNEIVVANQGKNELIIFGTPGDYKMAKKVVEKLDTKPTTTIFKVNHSTPKEMATMLCQSLFPNLANSGSSSDAATGDAAKANSTSEISLGGGVLACRVVASNSINSKLTSLNNSNLAVIYHPGQGSISLIGGSSEQENMVNEFIASHDKKQPAYL